MPPERPKNVDRNKFTTRLHEEGGTKKTGGFVVDKGTHPGGGGGWSRKERGCVNRETWQSKGGQVVRFCKKGKKLFKLEKGGEGERWRYKKGKQATFGASHHEFWGGVVDAQCLLKGGKNKGGGREK